MKKNAGNALWYILIVIFLLGGLTAMLTRQSTTTEETGDTERSSIKVSEIMRYTSGLSDTINKLLLNECSENQLSFYSSKWTTPANYDNPNTPAAGTNFNCHIFNVAGGGYSYQNLPTSLSTSTQYIITASNAILNVGTVSPDLVILAPNLSAAVCSQINSRLGVSSYAKESVFGNVPFVGTYTSASIIGDNGTNPTYVAGKKSACLQTDATGGLTNDSYVFYQVILAR